MTLIKRLQSLLTNKLTAAPSTDRPVSAFSTPVLPINTPNFSTEIPAIRPTLPNTLPLLPDWLTDEESLRDEGVLFGLSDAQPDEKIAEIKAYFSYQAAPFEQTCEQHTEQIGALNQRIKHHEDRIADLRKQINSLFDRQPINDNLARTLISLCLSVVMCVGNFYLIDETLHPVFPNRWIAIGVFLAGMFNLFGRTSLFYEEDSRLTGRRLLEEVSLPLAASLFVLAQAVQKQSFWQAGALCIFVFFLFLLAGKLLLSTLVTLRHDLAIIQANRRLVVDRQLHLPIWETQVEQLSREIDAIQTQKWPVQNVLSQTETDLTRLNARRDQLVNLFLSEFELARSLRDRLTEQQRAEILRSYNVM